MPDQYIVQHATSSFRDDDVVLNTDTNASPFFINIHVVCCHINTGLNGECHTRLKRSPPSVDTIFANVVDISKSRMASAGADSTIFARLGWLGRHTLPIYLLHQPVMLAIIVPLSRLF